MEPKSTLRTPSNMGKKFTKNFNNQMYSQGAGELTEIDSMLQEKEQSLKKQIWDLAKMESLVHSDPKLSAKYNEMAETGEETYGYHYNETIMNILFNDYVLNSQSYLQKYKNAIPAKKKRRDKSGINQLQQKGFEKMQKSTGDKKEVDEQSYDKNYVNAMKADLKGQGENPSKVNNMTPKQLENKGGLFNGGIEETTGAASSGAFTPALDFKTNRDLAENGDAIAAIRDEENSVDETTTSASSGAYVGPFGTKRHKKLDKPAWDGGQIIGENNYLTDPTAFKGIFESYENEVIPSEEGIAPVSEDVNPTHLKNLDTQFLQRILNSLFTTLDATKQQNPEADKDIALIQQELRSRGALKEPAPKKGFMSKLGSMLTGEGVELDENHLNTKAQKVDFIIQQTNKSGEPLSSQELMELPDETIDVMYNDLEKSTGISEEKIETGPDSGVYTFDKEKEQFQKSAEAQPQPAVCAEPPKDVNEYSDLDKEVLSRSARKKITLSQLLAWANENVLFSTNPQGTIEDFAAQKGVSLEQLKGVAEYYLENNLGFQGSVETSEQDVLLDLIETIDELTQVEEPVVAEPQGDVEEATQTGVESSAQGLRANIAKLLGKLMPHMASDLNQLMDFTDTTVKLFFNNDYNKAYTVIKSKVADLEEGILSGDGQSMINDNPTTMAATMKDVQSSAPMGEGVNEAVKKCRKDEKPVPGKLPGEKGACEKKNKIDPKERKENKYNVKTRIQREKEKEKRLEKRSKADDNSDADVLDKNNKHMKKLKEMTEGINEDKRPSALVQMDRLHKENEKNFKSDLKDSNTEDLKVKEDEMDALGQYSEVGDNPYELGEKIEKEKLAKIAKLGKDSALKNVGDSTNDSDTEIPKRNLTAGELEQLNLDRGLGMQDIVYDTKPSKRFVDRMKEDMGEEIYNHAQKKMEYRKNAPMYNKDTQPVADGINKNQFDKNEEGYNSAKGIKTESVITGKYRDEFNKVKFVDFKINEAVEVKETSGVLLNLAGLGNGYTQSVNENREMRNIMNSFDFYLDKGAVVKVARKQSLTEGKETLKPAVNEQLEKMKKLLSYDPSKRVDTSNVKKNRGF